MSAFSRPPALSRLRWKWELRKAGYICQLPCTGGPDRRTDGGGAECDNGYRELPGRPIESRTALADSLRDVREGRAPTAYSIQRDIVVSGVNRAIRNQPTGWHSRQVQLVGREPGAYGRATGTLRSTANSLRQNSMCRQISSSRCPRVKGVGARPGGIPGRPFLCESTPAAVRTSHSFNCRLEALDSGRFPRDGSDAGRKMSPHPGTM